MKLYILCSLCLLIQACTVTAPVVGIMENDLYVGEAVGYMDRTGTIDIHSVVNPDVRCVGEFRYTGSRTGVGEVVCNEGNSAEFRFNGLGMASGYGYGKSTKGPFSFTYGLDPEESEEYLKVPEGSKYSVKDDQPTLERI